MQKNTATPFDPSVNYIMDLPSLGLLKISGDGAKALLQGQLTCDVNAVSATETCLGAHCNPQGRMISFFRLFYYQNSYYLQMPRKTITEALAKLKKYAVFFKVDLLDVSDELSILGYAGNGLQEWIPVLPETPNAMITSDYLIINIPGPYLRFEIMGSPALIEKLTLSFKNTVNHQTEALWKYLDIESEIPTIYPETIETFLPHELNLTRLNAISFNKGCYTGQEIIARMEYRGKLKNRLFRATIECENTPVIGADIYHETGVAGSIVDYCETAHNQYQLLIITNGGETLFMDSQKQHRLLLNS